MPDFYTSIFRADAPSYRNGPRQQSEGWGGQDHLIMLAGTDSAIQLKGNAVSRTNPPGATPQGWWGFSSRALVSPNATCKLRLPLPDLRAGARSAPRGRISYELEVKLYAVLQLPGRKVPGG
jgi:hypothetical protein